MSALQELDPTVFSAVEAELERQEGEWLPKELLRILVLTSPHRQLTMLLLLSLVLHD